MNILNELKEFYKFKSSETVDSWLTRLIKDFLNLDDVPADTSLATLGVSSLSAAILIDIIKRETGASISIAQAMGKSSISSLTKAIHESETFMRSRE